MYLVVWVFVRTGQPPRVTSKESSAASDGDKRQGDIFTAVLSGAVMRGYSPYDAAELAMNFTTKAIQATVDTVKSMKQGVAFELVLPELTQL